MDGRAPGDQDELVVGRDSELVHGHDTRVETPLLEVDPLDVPVAAEDGVDLPPDQGGQQVEADVDLAGRRRGKPGRLEDGLEVVALVRDPCGPDRLALEVGGAAIPPFGSEIREVSGWLTIAATASTSSPWSRASSTSGS